MGSVSRSESRRPIKDPIPRSLDTRKHRCLFRPSKSSRLRFVFSRLDRFLARLLWDKSPFAYMNHVQFEATECPRAEFHVTILFVVRKPVNSWLIFGLKKIPFNVHFAQRVINHRRFPYLNFLHIRKDFAIRFSHSNTRPLW